MDGKDKLVTLKAHVASIICLVLLLGATLSVLFGNSSAVSLEVSGQCQLHGSEDYYIGWQTSASSLHFFGEVNSKSEMVVSVLSIYSGEKIAVTGRSGNFVDFHWIFPGPGEYWLRISSEQTVNISFTCQVYRSSYVGTVIGIFLSFLAIPFWVATRRGF